MIVHPDEDLFPRFDIVRVPVEDAEIHARVGGSGPPLLLLHGFPQSHACWHRIAPELAKMATVIAADLPGYGDSKGPAPDPRHFNYSKRASAARMREFMRRLGFERFAIAGHDRGGRVAYRMALDAPAALTHLIVLDIVPTLEIAEATDYRRALSSWYWSFLAQPAPLPERLIAAEADFLLDYLVASWQMQEVFDPRVLAEYRRFINTPSVVEAYCEDYRAGLGIDLEFDRADREAGHRIACPLTVLWGETGTHSRYVGMLDVWRRWAADVSGRAIDAGHFLPEQAPAATAAAIIEALAC